MASSSTGSVTRVESSSPAITVKAIATEKEKEEEEQKKHLQWAEDVVDNENMGKKKSKSLQLLF